VAIKTINKNSEQFDRELFLEELTVMQNIDHPNIVKFYEVFEDKFHYNLVMEYCSGGDLADKLCTLESYSELQASEILLTIF
jgi:serine/threonine protein kinase